VQLAIETLLDGVMQTLREVVLPAVQERFARGQLFAALDVLQNLRDRVEPKVALDEAEAASAGDALARALQILGPAGAPLADALSGAPTSPPAARVAALRATLCQAFALLDGLPEDVAAPARSALAEHLSAQAMRDVAILKPSLLQEISKG
jgi:HAMP domain-containing protein